MIRPPSKRLVPLGVLLAVATILLQERSHPLRPRTQAEPRRSARNLALGALSLAVVAGIETPLVNAVAGRVEPRRLGLAQRLPLPRLARDMLGVLLMNYTIYLWHVATHKVPLLWRLHLVHHVDLDLDASTALRFHGVDMLVSVPVRLLQVRLLGVSTRALEAWRRFFFLSVLFHHSNWRLPRGLDRRVSMLLTTPAMHGLHHTAREDLTNANWSSGLSVWDRLHGTLLHEADGPANRPIGVPAVREPAALGVRRSLLQPFAAPIEAWRPPARR